VLYGYDGRYQQTPAIVPGKGYWVRASAGGKLILSSSPPAGTSSYLKIVATDELPPPPPDQALSPPHKIPQEFSLLQNYPNPFNPTARIAYALPRGEFVSLQIYNTLGQIVATLINENEDAGYKSVEFSMGSLPSGVYFYRLRAGAFTETRKMLLMK
jgi:hypothetical protein